MLNNFITTTIDIKVYLKVLSEKEQKVRQLSLETLIKDNSKRDLGDKHVSGESPENKKRWGWLDG